MNKKKQNSEQAETGNATLGVVSKRAFVNVYEDDEGRFIGDEEYTTYESAFENRDDLSTYRETVEIIRHVC